jgi:hypothetical protein
MPSLKGLACVSLVTLAIAAPPAFAQSSDTTPAPRSPTTSPANPSAAPTDQSQGTHKHRKHRSRSSSSGQPAATPSNQN